jgi:hypothetical protein
VSITPIGQIERRLPQAGRIRLGEKGAKGPKALAKFRFSSSDRTALVKIAELYGGEPKAWREPKTDDAFELYTEASEIEVVLPPDCYTAAYELWGGAGLVRRCDGENCVVQVPGPDGPEPVERPCVCEAKGEEECDPRQRLRVVLPEVRFFGVWRLDTNSWHAAQELPTMIEMIEMVDGGRHLTKAVLRIEKRHRVLMTSKGPRRKNYNVPCLGFAESIVGLAAGQGRLAAGPQGEVLGDTALADLPVAPRELAPGAPPIPDDEVIEATVVPDTEELERWVAALSAKDQARALRMARQLAEAIGEPIPTTFESITPRTLEHIYEAVQQQ